MLDGEYVPHVLTADEEEGLVLRGASDEDGNVLRDGDVILTVELRGVVKIIIPTVPPPDREQ